MGRLSHFADLSLQRKFALSRSLLQGIQAIPSNSFIHHIFLIHPPDSFPLRALPDFMD